MKHHIFEFESWFDYRHFQQLLEVYGYRFEAYKRYFGGDYALFYVEVYE